MEKYTIEIETTAGWVQYHAIMREGIERAQSVAEELGSKFPGSKFRIVKWTGGVIK